MFSLRTDKRLCPKFLFLNIDDFFQIYYYNYNLRFRLKVLQESLELPQPYYILDTH